MTTIEKVRFLRNVQLFAHLTDETLVTLAESCVEESFPEYWGVFQKGAKGDACYVVTSGSVRIEQVRSVYDSSLGRNVPKPVPLAWRTTGEHFGEMALIDGKPRMADAIAMEPTKLLKLGRDAFDNVLNLSPNVARNIMVALADRLREAADLLVRNQSFDVRERLSAMLLHLAELGSDEIQGGGLLIREKHTHDQLADQMGVARESVSRAWKNLKDEGAVRRDKGHIAILNPVKLKTNCVL